MVKGNLRVLSRKLRRGRPQTLDLTLLADGDKPADNDVDCGKEGSVAKPSSHQTEERPNLFRFLSAPSHAPFFEHLPADKMAVITMHNLMGLLMIKNGGVGAVNVVQLACAIGEALENEVKMHRLLEKTKKKSIAIKKPEAESDTMTYEQETLTKELEQEKLTKEQRPSYIVYQIAK
ncbi:hypothetical protein M0R45_035115 [Rubus argutus]|uniref:DNA-directed RNA polymerase N-terminal domain-containing protein n=1 Tax=Rubus argutus TaxID=59490 RepID=A0AAW1VWL4_RUBAR